MRLTERVREFISKVGLPHVEKNVCNFERWLYVLQKVIKLLLCFHHDERDAIFFVGGLIALERGFLVRCWHT